MIGLNLLQDKNGVLSDGFEHDFFAVTKPEVSGDVQVMGIESDGMNYGRSGNGKWLYGDVRAATGSDHSIHSHGRYVSVWTMGCFETSSGKVHFDQGMAGILVVLPQ